MNKNDSKRTSNLVNLLTVRMILEAAEKEGGTWFNQLRYRNNHALDGLSLSRILKRLIKSGFVTKEKVNRQKVIYKITSDGMDFLISLKKLK